MAFHRIVVGLDGREGGDDALALARRIAATGAELHLAGILETEVVTGPAFGHDDDSELVRETRGHLEAAAAAIADRPVTVHPRHARTVSAGLEELAAELGADLIVIGSCGRGRLGRLLAGDDTRETLHAARRPVAIAPRGFAADQAWRVGTIGVGIDESAESEQALDLAGRMRGEHHARLEAVEVLPPPWPVNPVYAGMLATMDEEREHAQARLLAHEDVDQATVVVGPSAHAELRDLADRVDLLVVGSRPRSAFGRLAFGSTSDALTDDLASPLLVVPHVKPAPPG